jgi:zinc transporter ZupT
MMASMFCLFIIEMYMNTKMGGHSHGGPMGFETQHSHRPDPPRRPPRYTSDTEFEIEDVEYEKKMAQKMYEEKVKDYQRGNPFSDPDGVQSEMPPWFIVFYEQYVRQRLEMINMIKASSQQHEGDFSAKRQSALTTLADGNSPYIDVETGQAVDPAVYRKMSMNITLLEGGILFHSVFVGMTVSITIDGFLILLIAILFHQMFEGLGLGSRIAAVPYPRGSIRPWVLVVAFGTTAPIGQAIGLIARNSYDPNSAFGLIIVGVFNAM